MPRYFFHVHNAKKIRDMEGTELPNLAAAQAAAVRLSGELLREDDGTFWNDEDWCLDVADGQGLILFTLLFTAVMAPATRIIKLPAAYSKSPARNIG